MINWQGGFISKKLPVKFLGVSALLVDLSIFFHLKFLKPFYVSLILPYFSYCNIVWVNTSRTNLDKLTKIARIPTNSPAWAHSQPILKNLNYLNIVNLNKYQQGLFMYRYLNQLLPNSFTQIFTLNLNLHSYNTRASSNRHFHILKHRTSAFKNSITYIDFLDRNSGIHYHCLLERLIQ